MSANSLHLILPAVLGLVGFHGLFFYDHLAGKTASWLLSQLGIIGFLLSFPTAAGPLPRVLALEAGAVGLALSLLMGVFCLKLWKIFKTLQGGEISKRVSK